MLSGFFKLMNPKVINMRMTDIMINSLCSGAHFLKLSSVEQFFTQLSTELFSDMRDTLKFVGFWVC